MFKGNYTLEIEDFPKKGLTTKFDVESWGLMVPSMSSVSGAGVGKISNPTEIRIRKPHDKYSNQLLTLNTIYSLDKKTVEPFPHVSMTHKGTNEKGLDTGYTIDLFDVFVTDYTSSGQSTSNTVSLDQFILKYKKVTTFYISVESVTSP